MKMFRIINAFFFIATCFTTFGQGSIDFSTPFIFSTVKFKNNWSPPTAINRKDYFNGTAMAYGANLTYSFRPKLIIKNENIKLTIGMGYLIQRFNIERPFDFESPLEPIFYTDHYSYHCFQAIIGVGYRFPVKDKFSLNANLSYSWLKSFRQVYTPISNHGYGESKQTNNLNLNFGHFIMLEGGVQRQLNSKLSAGFNVLAPIFTRWRNDVIFRDNPSEFSNPKFSLGFALCTAYKLKQ